MEPAEEAPQPSEFMAVVHPDDRDEVGESMGRSMVTPGAFESEYRVVLPDDSVRTLLVRGDLAPGATRRLAGTTRDITAEREARAGGAPGGGALPRRVRERADRHGRAVLDGHFVRVNAAMCDIVGHAARGARGPLVRVGHPPRRRGARRRPHRVDAPRRGGLAPGGEAVPARQRPSGLGAAQRHAGPRRRRPARPLPDPGPGHHRPPPLRAAAPAHGRPRSRSPACSTAAASSASSSATWRRSSATACRARRSCSTSTTSSTTTTRSAITSATS